MALDISNIENNVINYFVERSFSVIVSTFVEPVQANVNPRITTFVREKLKNPSVIIKIIKSDMIFPFIFAVDEDKMVNSNECY